MFFKILIAPFQFCLLIAAVAWILIGWIVFPMVFSSYLGGWGIFIGLTAWWIGVALIFGAFLE